jgi:hypothetical protein
MSRKIKDLHLFKIDIGPQLIVAKNYREAIGIFVKKLIPQICKEFLFIKICTIKNTESIPDSWDYCSPVTNKKNQKILDQAGLKLTCNDFLNYKSDI